MKRNKNKKKLTEKYKILYLCITTSDRMDSNDNIKLPIQIKPDSLIREIAMRLLSESRTTLV